MLDVNAIVEILIEPFDCEPIYTNDQKAKALASLANGFLNAKDSDEREELANRIITAAQIRTESFADSVEQLRKAA